MINILFNGRFQARFATDPEAYDHPRGGRGWTFAVAGEPDFDRVVRFSSPVAPRSHGPVIGVKVTEVRKDGQPVAGHSLVGATVDLVDGPKFEGHNGAIAGDGNEPVFPLHLQIVQGSLVLETTEWLTFADLKKPQGLLRHGKGATQDIDSQILSRLLGGLNPVQFRAERRAKLVTDLGTAQNQVEQDALRQRIDSIATASAADGLKLDILSYRVRYTTKIPPVCRRFSDPQNLFQLADPLQLNWTCSWWMGAWDADALTGYIEGSLDLT